MKRHVALGAMADHILDVKPLNAVSLQHLDNCTRCSSDFQWLKVLRNLGASQLPPEAAVTTAIQTFKNKTDAA